ncbi:MAG: hypothetical protein MUF59_06390 [Candidatus Krumholzibacteria bacterium]|nr:hypothetical protein [Candidatus Krumholzibacteria bacterium]
MISAAPERACHPSRMFSPILMIESSMEGLKSFLSIGTSRFLILFLRKTLSLLLGSAAYLTLIARRYDLSSSRPHPRTGLMKMPLLTGIPARPRHPEPLIIWCRIVSTWSSRLCPRATEAAPHCLAALSRNAYLMLRADSSIPRTEAFERAGTSPEPASSSIPSLEQYEATSAASRSDPFLILWSKWAAARSMPSSPESP